MSCHSSGFPFLSRGYQGHQRLIVFSKKANISQLRTYIVPVCLVQNIYSMGNGNLHNDFLLLNVHFPREKQKFVAITNATIRRRLPLLWFKDFFEIVLIKSKSDKRRRYCKDGAGYQERTLGNTNPCINLLIAFQTFCSAGKS